MVGWRLHELLVSGWLLSLLRLLMAMMMPFCTPFSCRRIHTATSSSRRRSTCRSMVMLRGTSQQHVRAFHHHSPKIFHCDDLLFLNHHHNQHHGYYRYHQHQTVRHLNRFLFDPEEVDQRTTTTCSSGGGVPVVTLPKDDYRTVHAAKILGLQNGDTIRAGVVSCPDDNNDNNNSGLLTDTATIEWIPEGKVKKAEPLQKSGDPPGSLRIHLRNLTTTTPSSSSSPTLSPVALLLALPRPIQLGRMLPMISQMGVSRLILTCAQKVPKDYFGSHLFRTTTTTTKTSPCSVIMRQKLVEGLCQAGDDVRLPQVTVVQHNLPRFLETQLDALFPLHEYARVIAHPQRINIHKHNHDNSTDDDTTTNTDTATTVRRMRDVEFPTTATTPNGNNNNNNNTAATTTPARILLAVGPEGGWEEPEELDLFQQHQFQQITLGSRVLRSDCAVVSLLALAHDACNSVNN